MGLEPGTRRLEQHMEAAFYEERAHPWNDTKRGHGLIKVNSEEIRMATWSRIYDT